MTDELKSGGGVPHAPLEPLQVLAVAIVNRQYAVTPNVRCLAQAFLEAAQQIRTLQEQLAEQRAELTGGLSDLFKSFKECYDTPADHYREMARRLIESRDEFKHRTREAEAKTAELEAQIRTLQEALTKRTESLAEASLRWHDDVDKLKQTEADLRTRTEERDTLQAEKDARG